MALEWWGHFSRSWRTIRSTISSSQALYNAWRKRYCSSFQQNDGVECWLQLKGTWHTASRWTTMWWKEWRRRRCENCMEHYSQIWRPITEVEFHTLHAVFAMWVTVLCFCSSIFPHAVVGRIDDTTHHTSICSQTSWRQNWIGPKIGNEHDAPW